MNRSITTIAFSVLIGLMVTALSVTCTDSECVKRHTQATAQVQTAENEVCTDKIVYCGSDQKCPYPGQRIEVVHTGSADCGDNTCICHCPQPTATNTGTDIKTGGL